MAYPTVPRDLIRRAENENFPLIGLGAIKELREALDALEAAAILRAREMGASTTDVATALGVTRQAAYYRVRHLLERQAERNDVDAVVIVPESESMQE